MPIVYKHPVIGWRVAKTNDEKSFENMCKEKGLPYAHVKKLPSLRQLEKWVEDGICPTPDGCRVEPDGSCCHEFPSWLLILGFI